MAPVQRTAKAWVVVSRGLDGVGEGPVEVDFLVECVTMAGAPSKPGWAKYWPSRPSTVESPAARSMVRGTGSSPPMM